jgi:PTS system nitrogen regulatory IIA component
MKIHELINPERVRLAMPGSSKKRVLEQLCEILGTNTNLDFNTIFQAIFERERIGSTAIGQGIALPHGRLKGLQQAVGAFAVLEQPIDFDAIDQQPVTMVFALLVPEEATDEHLQLLAQLARIFNDKKAREKLSKAESPEAVCKLLQSLNPDQAVA